MPLNIDFLRTKTFAPIETTLTDKDVMFYALSIGLGRDPMDAHDLSYVFEKNLKVFPTMPLVIGHPGPWQSDPETGITRTMVVHGSQRLWTFKPLPVGVTIVTTNRILDIFDKGDKGAVIVIERETKEKDSGDLVSRGESYIFCRADGGFGGASGPAYEFAPVPDRTPDAVIDVPTEPNMALIYRLNHDRNPLHADPEFAARAKFPRPILHGLATFGAAATAIARRYPDKTISAIESRFSKPVFPGETISVDMWEEGDAIAFRARIAERGIVVLDRAQAQLG